MTNELDWGLNSHEVKAAIKQSVLLKDVDKNELARIKVKLKKRLRREASAKVPAKTEVENWDKASFMKSDLSISREDDPDYNPE